MAYRVEKSGDIVIDGFEKGIADSPYQGIANIRNLNIKYYPGVAYGNYKRQATTLSWGTFTFTGSLSMGATSATLTAVWPYATGNYAITFSNADVRANASFTNGSTTVGWAGAGGLSSGATATITVANGVMAKPTFGCTGNTGIKYIIDDGGLIWKQTALNSSSFSVLQSSPTTGAQGQGIAFWNNYLVVFRANFIDFCGDGTGDGGVTSSNWMASNSQAYIGNITTLALSGAVAAGDTSANIQTYTDAGGNSRSTTWFGATGTYQLVLTSSGETIPVLLTNGSTLVKFAYPSQVGGTAAGSGGGNKINILIGTTHMTYISSNDGNLYFCNSNGVGALGLTLGAVFSPTYIPTSSGTSYTLTYRALGLPTGEVANWISELIGNLMILGNFKLYPWNRVSPQWSNPIPIPEQGFRIINILNNLYVLAGYKGNIYLSNGYSAYPFKKIPDYIANNTNISVNDKLAPIDPQWLWGGVMSHRLRLFFQALAVDGATGTNLMSGIFSVGLVSGNGVTLETPGSLVMENQNSYGLVSSTTTSGGVLLENNTVGLIYDNYYSAWSNGVGDVGGIDFNDTTLYSSNEMIIESDLIPIGTSVNPKTFSSAEFKFDEPMKSGDSISLYARQSLSDTYTLLGTTSSAVLSNFTQGVNFQEWQWLQLMATMSCNSSSTSSSFNRLREVRIR